MGVSLCTFTTHAFANTTQMYRDDTLVSLKQEVLVGNDVLVPLREICENLGYTVSWDGDSRLIRLQKNFYDVLIDLTSIGKNSPTSTSYYPKVSEKLNLLEEIIVDNLEHLKTSTDEDAKIGHKTADTSFFGYKTHLAMTYELLRQQL